MPEQKFVLVDVKKLAELLRDFANERDWTQFHSPKNLAMALAGEVGELLEIFQWMSEDKSRQAASEVVTKQAVSNELADVLIYLVRMADVLGVDLNAAVTSKLAENASKYPIDASRGNAKKYTDL